MSRPLTWILAASLSLAGCGTEPAPIDTTSDAGTVAGDDAGFAVPELLPPGPIVAEPQRDGDPAVGYRTLVEYGYVTCGIPYSAWSRVAPPGAVPEALKLPGREGMNADLPYFLTATTAPSGVDIVAPNCLSCHGSVLSGRVVIGLGNASSDFTSNQATTALLARALVPDAEADEWQRFYDRASAVGPRIVTKTIGVNSADNLAAVLFSYRDADTLAWLGAPALPITPIVVPVDVPPWWRMKKKNAMFYTASGRGDHVRLLIGATSLCSDTVEEVAAIDAVFDDVLAYIKSIEPPRYPYSIDAALAERGRGIFDATCARCHGTYGATDDEDTYPNLVVGIDEIGTDALLMNGPYFSEPYIDWFSRSFYGQTARIEPHAGYVAPPLDGIWATAPYLHNGSVPTLAALLDSAARPRFWTRDFDRTVIDADAVGWPYTALEAGHDSVPYDDQRTIYDTTQLGYGSGGHTFADALTAEDRSALLEYLKTL